MIRTTENNRGIAALAFCAVLCCCALAHAVAPATTELLAKFPAQSAQDRDALCAEAVKLGPDFILNEALAASTTPVFDAKVQFLLNGMADYVARPDAAEERKAFSATIAKAVADANTYLKAGSDDERKENIAFLMSLLQNVGDADCVEAISPCLADDRLCDPAARALVSINTPNAAEALCKSLEAAANARRIAVVQALGELRCKACIEPITKDALGEDAPLRRTAVYALAKIGDITSLPILARISETGVPHDKAEATALYIEYTRNLAAGGAVKEAETICRELMAERSAQTDSNVRCEALSTLADIKGKAVLDDLLAAVDTNDKELRGCALRLACNVSGKRSTGQWIEKLKAADPERRIEIIRMLGDRGDQSALFAIVSAFKDDDKNVRLNALLAATRLGEEKSFSAILAMIDSTRDDEEAKAVKEALLRIVGEDQLKPVALALSHVSPAAKKSLLEILGARRATEETDAVFAQLKDADESVRTAALAALENVAAADDHARIVDALLNAQSDAEKSAAQKAVVAVGKLIEDPEARATAILERYAVVPPEKKLDLLPTLSGVGGKQALDIVIAETRGTDPALRDAAVRVLADWPDAAAVPELLNLAKSDPDETKQVLALRGAARLLGPADMTPAQKVGMLKEAMAAAKRPEERTLMLGTLADIRDLESLRAVAAFLDDEALKAEAALAAAKIACPRDEADKGLDGQEVVDILKKAASSVADADMKKKLDNHLLMIDSASEDGFVSLFNGTDLTGWIGDVNGYVAENGAIVCKPGGNLFTAAEYADFVFRFDFKLTPNANNGIGIRAPLDGNAAYAGMEIQVLDDSGSEYTKLQPYQYHGSIYGVVPCERGHQKPVGEWNSEEIIAKGAHVVVKLNGATIVDADIAKASEGGTMDHNDHPGLKNTTGHIGFLGHGSVVEFKNMRVKELK